MHDAIKHVYLSEFGTKIQPESLNKASHTYILNNMIEAMGKL